MRNFFQRFEGATWPQQKRIHAYLRATDELRSVVYLYHEKLRENDLADKHGLGLQTLPFLHFTAQMCNLWLDDLEQKQIDDVSAALKSSVGTVTPFTLQVGPPQVSTHAVELWVNPDCRDQWTKLVHSVRAPVLDVFGDDAVPGVTSNGRAHTSIGYGKGVGGDSGVLMSALKTVEHGLVTVPVNELVLVAVTQIPEEGRFVWDEPLAVIPLGEEAA